MNESGLSKNKIIAELSKSAHGSLQEYVSVGKQAATEHGEFFAHLIAWDRLKGAIRDSKIALPIVSLLAPNYPAEFVENSLAALSLLNPREQLKALRFVLETRVPGHMTSITHTLGISLLEREKNWPKWERQMLQHRAVLKELFTNTKMLERLGIKTNPALRGAFQEALEKAGKSTANILKTTRAAENIDDEELKENLRGLQEKQIASLGGEGNWAVLADKSGSMTKAIELAKHVAATLAKLVHGKVWLIFFDTAPQSIDVTGMALDVIKNVTRYVQANGGTSIGSGLLRLFEAKEEVDGVCIISDGGENTAPTFPDVYKRYSEMFRKMPPVYLYQTQGDSPALITTMQQAGHDMQVFDLRGQETDFYSLPNLVQTMRTQRFSLSDEIMGTKLLQLSDAYKTTVKKTATA